MLSDTLAIGLLLGLGFACAKVAQLLRLPSVTGYIVAGLAMGPSGLGLITGHTVGANLDHFTELALVLVAFGIGEHLDWNKLKRSLRNVAFISLGESGLAFVLVAVGVMSLAKLTGAYDADWTTADFLALALLLGAVSVATAPAATMMVMRESRAAGPLTNTLMAVVAANNGLALTIFGISLSIARQIVGATDSHMALAVASGLVEIAGSLALGLITGLLIDMVIHRLRRRGEMLTLGLALLLIGGSAATILDASPLLMGMAAGCAIVNRDHRDVRLFRALNDFEPPIYVLFFTLAGAHLDIDSLAVAGWVCLAYFALRLSGKMLGSYIGARLAGAPPLVRRWIGLALMPQAGIAIGLVFLIQNDPNLGGFARLITPVVLGGVFLAELVGPAAARVAFSRAGETAASIRHGQASEHDQADTTEPGGYQLMPWTWDKLEPPAKPRGSVLFLLENPASAAGLARMAGILAHGMHALPMALCIVDEPARPKAETLGMMSTAAEQIRGMGGHMLGEIATDGEAPFTVTQAAREHEASLIMAAQPMASDNREAHRQLAEIIDRAPCPVITVGFKGVLHTERILAPVQGRDELRAVGGVIWALSSVGMHRISLMTMLPFDAIEEELEEAELELLAWARDEGLGPRVRAMAIPTENRAQSIVKELREHDLLVMPSLHHTGLQRVFSGDLAQDVLPRASKPTLLVHQGRGAGALAVPL